MANLKEIQRKIKSVSSTQKTTRAMKLVSTAKLRRAEELAKRSRLFAEKTNEMIAELAGQQAKLGATNLLFFIALISVNLAILNILPIPVLDGGHLLFFAIEMVIRRPVSIRVREVAQQAGMFVLILLMVFVFYNDITRIFSGQ